MDVTIPEPATSADLLYCPFCMYDLRGSSGDSCPECGGALDPEGYARSSIPWVYRKLPFAPLPMLRTCYRVTRHTRLFCTEIARPVDLRMALRFRAALALYLWLAVVVPLGAWMIAGQIDANGFTNELNHLRRGSPVLWWSALAYGLAGLWLVLFMALGVHTYAFHPKPLPEEVKRRALALSEYANGPLIGMLIPSLLLTVSAVLAMVQAWTGQAIDLEDAAGFSAFVASIAALIVFAATVSTHARFAFALAHRGWLSTMAMLALTGLSWLGLPVVLFGVLPAVGYYLYLIFETL